MGNATLQELFEFNPALSQCRIRVDTATQRGSVFDVICIVTGKEPEHSNQTFSRLHDKITEKCYQIRINGKGHMTYVADAPTLIEIVWELPGKAAKAFRRQSAHLIARYLGADRTLIDEIEARYERVPTEAKIFLQAHVERPEVAPLSNVEAQNILKRKRDELEMAELDARLLEQKLKTIEIEAKHKNTLILIEAANKNALIKTKSEEEALNGTIALSRTRLVANPEFQGLIQNDAHIQSAFNNYVKQSIMALVYKDGVEEGKEDAKFDFCPDFATLCQELGFGIVPMGTLSKIGVHTARKFRNTFQKEPEKTKKYVNGGNHMVMTYRLEHLEWLKDCVREVMKPA